MTYSTRNEPPRPSAMTIRIIRQIARAYNSVILLDDGRTLHVGIN